MDQLTDRILRRVIAGGASLALLLAALPGQADQPRPSPPSLRQAGAPISSGPPSLNQSPPRHSSNRPLKAQVEEIIGEANRHFRLAELQVSNEETREQHYAKAEQLAKDALALDEDLAQAHFLLFAVHGRRLLADGVQISEVWQFPKLNRHLKRCLELDPDHAHALAAKGGLLLDLPPLMGGDPEAALEYLQRALELNPMGLRTRITLARALLRQGEHGQARQQLLTAAHYGCRLGRRAVIDEAEELLADLDSNAETGETAKTSETHKETAAPLPWQPRSASAATPPPSSTH